MYERILVGTDGSATAAKAVERAVEVASTSGAPLTIMAAARSDRGEPIVAAARDAHAASSVPIETLVVDNDPVHALLDTAREGGYDLVVVGNKGMTGVRPLLPPRIGPEQGQPPPPLQPAHRQDDVRVSSSEGFALLRRA